MDDLDVGYKLSNAEKEFILNDKSDITLVVNDWLQDYKIAEILINYENFKIKKIEKEYE